MKTIENDVFTAEFGFENEKNLGILKLKQPINDVSEIKILHYGESLGYGVLGFIDLHLLRWLIGIADDNGTPVLYATPAALQYLSESGNIGSALAHEVGHWTNLDPVKLKPEDMGTEVQTRCEMKADEYAASIYGTDAVVEMLQSIVSDLGYLGRDRFEETYRRIEHLQLLSQ